MVGGGQEEGLRPGTSPVALIVGSGRAAELAAAERESDEKRIAELREIFLKKLDDLEGMHLNGSVAARVSGNLSLAFDGVEAESLLLELKNVGLSAGSACHSGSHRPSGVLLAIGVEATRALCTIRVGIGRPNTAEEVAEVAERIGSIVRRMRAEMPGASG
jgi:cysteine desulfurase